MPACTVKQQRLFINAVTELFGPVDRPRFLLRIDRGPVTLASLLSNGVIAVLDRLLPQSTLLPVPKELSRRREDAERFADYLRQWVGPCELHELRGTDGAALFSEARRRGSTPESLPSRRRVWS